MRQILSSRPIIQRGRDESVHFSEQNFQSDKDEMERKNNDSEVYRKIKKIYAFMEHMCL